MNQLQEYNATIVAGSSLLLQESRQIAQLLLEGVDEATWHQAIVTENILQKRSPTTAKRLANLIRARLETMKPELWGFVVKGDATLASQALLAAVVKHSRLIGDFLDQVVRDHLRQFKPKISRRDWDDFFETCLQISPELKDWSEATKEKIYQITFRILADVKYIESVRDPRLTTVHLEKEIQDYLKKNQEDYVLRCMDLYS